jgi:Acetyltransferase (GNAT) domain
MDNSLSSENTLSLTGYTHPEYAASLMEFGIPRELPRCKGWILERRIQGFSDRDAMGCYPLFTCRDWSKLKADLEDVGQEFVCLSVVTDPFGSYDAAYLHRCFGDVVIPFKEHYVVDLKSSIDAFVCKHHKRNTHKALEHLYLERCQEPKQFIRVWTNLYDELIKRHSITGIPAFSKRAFARQLDVPGLAMFRAVSGEETVGILLWYLLGEVAYYHLGAYSSVGYSQHASFALFWFSIQHFAANGLRWLNLGAGAGVGGNGTDGLSRFKRGWSTGTRTAYFCGRIFDHAKYTQIANAKSLSGTDYFPVYRKGEFT